MSGYLAKTPYAAPAHAEMIAKKRFAKPMSAAGYQATIDRLLAVGGVQLSDISYLSDGLKITGVEVLPDFAADEKGPLILYNRGGNREYGALSPSQISIFMVPFAQRMRAGVLASNYRGNSGSEGDDEFGGEDVNDVLNLVQIGQQQPWWDGKNIFMLGWSRGGMMSYLCIKHGLALQAVMVGAAPADLVGNAILRERMDETYRQLVLKEGEDADVLLARRSALHWVEQITVPLLLLHGVKDDRVSVGDARRMHAALTDLGRDVRYVEYPEGDHFMVSERQSIQDHTIDWFTQHRRS